MSTGRLESFSDGVMAVAITLLVLSFTVPDLSHPAQFQHLGHYLGQRWPVYAAYVTSFLTIGVIWINHHVNISRLARADHSILILNLILLMTIVVIPYGTNLLSAYLKASSGQHLAAAVYGGTLLAMALAFTVLNRQILLRRPHLMAVPMSLEQRRATFRRTASGTVPYAVATALAAVSPYITLAITFALAVFYALPVANINRGEAVSAD